MLAVFSWIHGHPIDVGLKRLFNVPFTIERVGITTISRLGASPGPEAFYICPWLAPKLLNI